MCDYKSGDVIRYVHVHKKDPTPADNYEDPPWVLVTRNGKGRLLRGGFNYDKTLHREVTIGPSDRGQSGRSVAHPDEWPEEVCAAMARFKLTGAL